MGIIYIEESLCTKKTCKGQLVVVLDGTIEGRKLQLMTPPSRCLLAGFFEVTVVKVVVVGGGWAGVTRKVEGVDNLFCGGENSFNLLTMQKLCQNKIY
jgi:hypothetical protein